MYSTTSNISELDKQYHYNTFAERDALAGRVDTRQPLLQNLDNHAKAHHYLFVAETFSDAAGLSGILDLRMLYGRPDAHVTSRMSGAEFAGGAYRGDDCLHMCLHTTALSER